MSTKTVIRISLMVFILTLLCGGTAETVKGNPWATINRGTIEYEGIIYRLKPRITTIQIMGIDKWADEIEEKGFYRNGGQADFQIVAVFDDNAETVSILQINRDTMVDITITNLFGEKTGTQQAQICLAYAYGDGGMGSCRLAVDAMQRLLRDTPIDHYYAVSLDGISVLNDLLGGIEVTLKEDFSIYDPAMTAGKTLQLQGKQAEYYVRYRISIGDGSNAERMDRQKDYLTKAKDAFLAKFEESSSFLLEVFDALSDYTVTDMGRGLIINLANKAEKYAVEPLRELDGIKTVGDKGYVEFYPDEHDLMKTILDLFYEPVSN